MCASLTARRVSSWRRLRPAVTELAARAGVDPSPIERQARPDRRGELLETFFELAQRELSDEGGARARAYLERRGFPSEAINDSRLGVVPPAKITHEALADIGYRDPEIRAAGILADTRWPGRLCGAWRNEWGKIGTFWARAADDHVPPEGRYLYLRGASRTNLRPTDSRATLESSSSSKDSSHHQLAARGVENVAALGGTSTSPRLFEQLSRRGVETVVLCFDNDDAGRVATAKAVEHAAGAPISPAIYVVSPEQLDAADDPDALIRRKGLDGWKELLESRECGVAWRAKEILAEISPAAAIAERREALRRAGTWLGTLPRLAIEQEDAVRTVAARTGYTPDAVGRAFRARYWDDGQIERTRQPELEQSTEPEL